MILNIEQVQELKREAEKHNNSVHICDSCAGQAFVLGEPASEKFKAFLTEKYGREKVRFYTDDKSFTIL